MRTLFLALTSLICFGYISSAQEFYGYALYNKLNNNNTYLIDKDGNIAYSWNCDIQCSYSVYMLDNGNLMRAGKYGNNHLNGAAVSGIVQEIDPDGEVVWEYIYSTQDYCTHHDFQPLPNGNVLLVAWETKTYAAALQAGSDDPDEIWPVHIIEVEKDGTEGNIVWEWHIWDHLIQDHDPTKDNYGVVAEHPELLDINVSAGGGWIKEWLHTNGIGYNAELDHITFSMRHIHEVFIIDHSTTTEEAAGHTGGNSGMGGDILYRWGKPYNYGAAGVQIITNAVHDAHWVPADNPNGGYLMFFNNDGYLGESCVDAIETPFNGTTYDLTPGLSYDPPVPSWRHICLDDAWGQSAAERLPNGNTFVNMSGAYMYEVDSMDNLVWQFNQGPAKAYRYGCDHPGIQALLNVDCNCDEGGTAYIDDCGDCVGGNTGLDPCPVVSVPGLNKNLTVDLYPNPTTGYIKLSGEILEIYDFEITITDIHGKIVVQHKNIREFDLSSFSRGLYYLNIYFYGAGMISKKTSLIK